MIGHNMPPGSLRAFADRILRLEAEIKELNGDKSEVYKEAKSEGFEMKALRNTIRRYRDLTGAKRHEVLERDAIEEIYLAELMREDGTGIALARTHEAPSVPDVQTAVSPEAIDEVLAGASPPPLDDDLDNIPAPFDRRIRA